MFFPPPVVFADEASGEGAGLVCLIGEDEFIDPAQETVPSIDAVTRMRFVAIPAYDVRGAEATSRSFARWQTVVCSQSASEIVVGVRVAGKETRIVDAAVRRRAAYAGGPTREIGRLRAKTRCGTEGRRERADGMSFVHAHLLPDARLAKTTPEFVCADTGWWHILASAGGTPRYAARDAFVLFVSNAIAAAKRIQARRNRASNGSFFAIKGISFTWLSGDGTAIVSCPGLKCDAEPNQLNLQEVTCRGSGLRRKASVQVENPWQPSADEPGLMQRGTKTRVFGRRV